MKLTDGGYGSAKHVDKKAGMKVEPKARAMSPEAVGQQGASLAFARKPLDQGPGYTPGKMGSTGIANARQGHAGPGPGGGNRTIYPSGAQGQHGPVNRGETNKAPDPPATAPGRDILSMYGPESKRGR
jgi:hypothetical protein